MGESHPDRTVPVTLLLSSQSIVRLTLLSTRVYSMCVVTLLHITCVLVYKIMFVPIQ